MPLDAGNEFQGAITASVWTIASRAGRRRQLLVAATNGHAIGRPGQVRGTYHSVVTFPVQVGPDRDHDQSG